MVKEFVEISDVIVRWDLVTHVEADGPNGSIIFLGAAGVVNCSSGVADVKKALRDAGLL